MRGRDAIDEPVLVTPAGDWRPRPGERPALLLPGAFNPVHAGHWGLAETARDLLGGEVAFELSLHNVDKPELDAAEVELRLAQFRGRAPVWLTRAPRFTQKAALFPGAVFVVGADTAARVLSPRYHDGDPASIAAALGQLRGQGCRFLVAARRGADGALLTMKDLACPAAFADLFDEIPEARFRLDLSSTELRSRPLSTFG